MAIYDFVLGPFSPTALASQSQIIGAFRSQGAVSPETARSASDLNVPTDEVWNALIIEGRVREGPPGKFYLFERRLPSSRERIVKLLLFWLLIIIIPVVLILLSDRRG